MKPHWQVRYDNNTSQVVDVVRDPPGTRIADEPDHGASRERR